MSIRKMFGVRAPVPAWLTRVLGVSAILMGILAWYLVTAGRIPEERLVSPILLPSPREVMDSFPVLFNQQHLVPSLAATLKRVLAGFGLAILVGVPLGIMAGVNGLFRAIATPYSLFLRNIPVAVLIPLTVFWFGIDEQQKILFIFIATLPFVFASSQAAIATVPERFVETGLTLGAKAWQVVSKILIPMALPDIYIALRSLFGMAFGYIMLAELINAKFGLGYLINTGQRLGDRPAIFAILIIIGIVAWVIDKMLYLFQLGFFPYRANQE